MTKTNSSNAGAVNSSGGVPAVRVSVPAMVGGNAPPAAGGGTSPAPTSGKMVSGFRLKLQQMLAGVQSQLPPGLSLPMANATHVAQAALVQTLAADLALYAAVDQDRQVLGQDLQKVQAQLPDARQFYAELKAALLLFYKKGNPALAQFGITAKVGRVQQTATQRVVTAVKAKATRALRGTASKKQKAGLKYQGTVVVSAVAAPGSTAPALGAAATPQVGVTPQVGATPQAGAK